MAKKRSPAKVENEPLRHPWLVAVWPGMGNVALNAGVYLLAKLDMTLFAEFEASGFFDVDHVEVKDGVIRSASPPKSRLFLWTDPESKHDIIVFLGEAQPLFGKLNFCRQLISFAKDHGMERVFTFAAMATDMHLEQRCRVFGASTEATALEELKQLELTLLKQGHIGGLNGVLLGVAGEAGLPGTCLLGEMPHVFHQFPYPKASLAILEVFTTIASIDLNLNELAEQAREVENQLGNIIARVEQVYRQQNTAEEVAPATEVLQEDSVSQEDRSRIDKLFAEATRDRSKAFELKQELDRLGRFKEYEDRFLDLFKAKEK
jgi:proteasome assembly chaperone (PAC2) family protein